MENQTQVKFEVPAFGTRKEAVAYARITLGIPSDRLVVEIIVIGIATLFVGSVAVASYYLWGAYGPPEPDNETREKRKEALEAGLGITDDHLAATLVRASSFLTDEDFEKVLAELDKKGSLEKIRKSPVKSVRQVLRVFSPLGVKIDRAAIQAEWARMVEVGKGTEAEEEEAGERRSGTERALDALRGTIDKLVAHFVKDAPKDAPKGKKGGKGGKSDLSTIPALTGAKT